MAHFLLAIIAALGMIICFYKEQLEQTNRAQASTKELPSFVYPTPTHAKHIAKLSNYLKKGIKP